ncbi:MAG: phosphatidate cytidylyltransferase [Methanobrevibacter sp.]|nr:phosphatidate cytidylyltransferase [Methanobrevibacter sp.]MBO5966750.1 phosphatidate cytidylyltransferase [Methanobrevibacter sp.]MBO7443230.1 phosphatidate cytidylyltransferase [Methanobrevibacter sp.]MBO7731440.1 phosphatidate cytidylyltransferase [Methanobrevibacter sp.]MBP5700104.1 phosphatidate cytidylyltransferase [Methanobrevibacter sp.]
MLTSDIIALIVVYAYVGIIFFLAEKVLKSRPEVSRKFLHIMVGNMIFAMPFFSDPWIMLLFITLPVTIALFFLTEYSPITIKNSVTESGHALGLFFYALIWSILLLIYPILIDPNLLWIVALAIVPLVYGDGFAALVGAKWGRIKYHIFGGEKSIAGSLAMLSVTAVLSVFVWVFYTAMGYTLPELNFWYILIISAIATIAEAISYGGIDNLTVPSVTSVLYFLVATML